MSTVVGFRLVRANRHTYAWCRVRAVPGLIHVRDVSWLLSFIRVRRVQYIMGLLVQSDLWFVQNFASLDVYRLCRT